MRMTQFAGLSPRATSFLEKHGKKVISRSCEACGHPVDYALKRSTWGKTHGMFQEEIPLYEYVLENGETLREIVQAEPWSSGPVIFTCLENEMKKLLFKWPKKDVDNC